MVSEKSEGSAKSEAYTALSCFSKLDMVYASLLKFSK